MAATVASAALYSLAFPRPGWSALAWLALAPWLVALHSRRLAGRLGLGALWTFCAGLALGQWLPTAVAGYTQQPRIVGWLFLFGLTAFTALPFYLLFAAAYRPLARLLGGALFAAAAGTVALNAQLPDLEYATLTDKTVFISLGMIFWGA